MIDEFVKKALAEDIGRGDLYALVEPSISSSAKIIAKSDGVLAGVAYLKALARVENFELKFNFSDADSFKKGDILATLSGSSHTLLRVERTFLNILLHASSIATLTKKYIDIMKPYGVKLLDTRKTRPHLRVFEKYASRCGGATNHRLGLDDALMIKDTHLKTIKNLSEYIKKAREVIPFTTKIEIEAESFEVASEAMRSGADIVMCDNMNIDEIKKVVALRDANYKHILLEASGNISLDTLAFYAQSGVDAISTGSTIHQANWIDISMRVD